MTQNHNCPACRTLLVRAEDLFKCLQCGHRDRAECVPAAEIKAMREVVRACEKLKSEWTSKHVLRTPLDRAVVEVIMALDALGTRTEGKAVDDGHSQTDKCGDDCTLEVLRPGQVQCNHDGAKCPNKEASDAT